MKKYLCRIAVLAMAFAMAFALSACGGSGNTVTVNETDAKGLVEATGISLDAPAGAEDVTYGYIEGEETIAQVTFTLDGKSFIYRAAVTDETALVEEDDNSVSVDDGLEEAAELAGLEGKTWKGAAVADVGSSRGIYARSSDKMSIVSWIDVAPGIMYVMIANDNVEQMTIINVAQKAFVPMQGEVG